MRKHIPAWAGKALLAVLVSSLAARPVLAAYQGTPPLIVANGGTGATTLTAHGPLVGEGTGAIVALSPVAGAVMYQSGTGSDPAMSATPVLGVNASTTGTLGFANGGASGATVTVQNNGATAAYNFNLPTGAGSSGQILASAGGGSSAMTWDNISAHLTAGTGISLSGTTNVTINASGTTPTLTVYTTAASSYTFGATNLETVALNQSTTFASTANLPTAAANLKKCLKDGGNNFATHNVTVKASSGNIDGTVGTTGITMNQQNQELCFISDGTNWFVE